MRDALLEKKQKLSDCHVEAIRWRFCLAQVQAKNERERAALGEDFEFLNKINRLNYLPSDAPSRLTTIAQKCIVVADSIQPLITNGEMQALSQPLLTSEELTSLLVMRGNLTAQEHAEIQGHALQTLNILGKIPFTKHLSQVPKFAASHHERLDGSGYPFHLTAPDLSCQSRILAIADVFDALTTTDRPYRSSYDIEKALKVLQEEAVKGKLDKDLVDLFISQRVYENTSDYRNPTSSF